MQTSTAVSRSDRLQGSLHRRIARPMSLAAVLVTAALPASSLHAQQILEIEDSSLTSYLASSTPVQLIQPRALNRGVSIDGSLVERPGLRWACNGNPYGDGAQWSQMNRLEDLRLDTGAYAPYEVDLALPSIGVQWVIGRTFNGRQPSGGGIGSSDGYQGRNWMQTSQPELVRYEGATDADDLIYIVYGADRFLEFKRVSSGDTYKGVNGTAGVIKRTAGSAGTPNTPEKYEYIDQHGTITTFFGETYADQAAFQLWKIRDTAGNECYVGDASSMATAISSYNDSALYPYGAIETAFDSAGRRYTYTYVSYLSTSDGISRLTQVKAEINTGSWVTVGTVDYDYYGNVETHGSVGDLKHAVVTTPMTTGTDNVQTTYYRYYKNNWSNNDDVRGHPRAIKMIVHPEGWRRYEGGDGSFGDNDYLTETDENLRHHSAAWFEYESSSSTRRISKARFNGQCGCTSGGATGEYKFTYHNNGAFSGVSGYDDEWSTRTVVEQPDGTYFTQYFDETGQPLSRVITDGDPAASPAGTWVTQVLRGASTGSGIVTGCISEVRTPAANSTYTHNTSGSPDGAIAAASSAGLIYTFTRSHSGNLTGFLLDKYWKAPGTGGTSYFDSSMTYTSQVYTGTTPNIVRPLTDLRYEYTQAISTGTSGRTTTDLDYEFHSATSTDALYLAIKKLTTSHPSVSTGNNGSGSTTSTVQWFTEYGVPSFTKAADDVVSYFGYHADTGQLVTRIDDADTAHGDFTGVTIPSGATSSGTEIHNKTAFVYDLQGRLDTTTHPSGRVSKSAYVQLDDRRRVTLFTPKYVAGSTTSYAPASYTITNQAGGTEAEGVIGFTGGTTTTAPSAWVTASGNAYSCLTTGSVTRLSTTLYNDPANQVTERRLYTNFAGITFPGTSGTHFDATTYRYDPMGRICRVVDPTGTIDRTNYDALGRVTQREIGTNDAGDEESSLSGTNNMVVVEENVYDSGNDGENSHLTKRTTFVEGPTTNQRETNFINDVRGRAVVVLPPQAPYILNKFDNLGRTIAVGHYSSDGSLDTLDDPTSLQTNRVALRETRFDEKRQLCQTIRHNINQSTGASADTLETDYWYDSVGRQIKVHGEELTKTFYDRLSRPTHRFVIARALTSTSAESTYADADDVTDDIVLEEHQTVYDDRNGNVILQVAILRHVQGGSPGALDSNADGDRTIITASNVNGRLAITSHWYDANLERLTHSVAYGTYGIAGDATGSATFDRSTALQTADDARLLTSYTYPDLRQQHLSSGFYGTFRDVTDPKGTVTRTWFDDGGRTVFTIANYINGVPNTTGNNDDDLYTRYTYVNGLQTEMWVDLDGDNVKDTGSPADQVTKYFYGVTTGTGDKYSTLNSNRLLHAVVYPDSSNTGTDSDDFYTTDSDAVTYAYNAQGQLVYQKDQAGSILQHTYDTLGRLTQRRATTIASGFDTTVKRIQTSYLARGLMDKITQFDHASVALGTALDEVQYSYDGWGNLTKLDQDVDSAIGGSGRAAFDVEYSYDKSTAAAGRRTLRRDTMTMPDGTTVDYTYGSDTTINGASSRVLSLDVSSNVKARYFYAGANLLVGTELVEPNVENEQYSLTSGVYPDLDRFGRVTTSQWRTISGSSVAFYDADIAYDRASNITSVVDNVRMDSTGVRNFDAKYTLDLLYRLTAAEEGEVVSGSVSTNARRELWTLSQTGNFNTNLLNLNWGSDNDYSDTGEVDDARTHNAVNEITQWRPDGSTNLNPAHDAVGNMTDDGRDYEFEYDVFGRLVLVTDQSSNTVSRYQYNGLGHRIGWQYDADLDTDPDNDPWYFFCYDERWRVVATYRDDDTSPKEQFYYHAAGLGGLAGHGASSYIDSVIWRDRDADTAWTSDSDGTLEERRYYCQNWRADVSTVLTDVGEQVENIKYAAYGTPTTIIPGDADGDGTVESVDDYALIQAWTGGATYRVIADINLDGTLDATDLSLMSFGTSGGRGVLSRSDTANRKGYAGYENDGVLADSNAPTASNSRFWHVRYRVLDSTLGRWTRRDPAGYVDGTNLCNYTHTSPIVHIDSYGLLAGRNEGEYCSSTTATRTACLSCCGSFGPPSPGCLEACGGRHTLQLVIRALQGTSATSTSSSAGGGTAPTFTRDFSCSELMHMLMYEDAGEVVDGNDKFQHCYTSCRLAQTCGSAASGLIGTLKEHLIWAAIDSQQDIVANQYGIACGRSSNSPGQEINSSTCRGCCSRRYESRGPDQAY